MELFNRHEMTEAQVVLRLEGALEGGEWVTSARAGHAWLKARAGRVQQQARSTALPAELGERAETLRLRLVEQLGRFADLPMDLRVQAMVRERQVLDVRGYRQSFSGFWGHFRLANQWTSIFGANPQGELVFRRGPWENWPAGLPELAEVDPRLPLILSPYCATLFHEAVGHALEDDYLAGSPLKFYRGDRISHTELVVMDRPDLDGYAGSMSHDDVGWPVSATTLIQQGFLVGDLSHRHGAHRRASYREAPLVRATNFLIRAGTDAPAAWLESLPAAHYVCWIQSGNWQPGGERFKVLTGPVVRLEHGRPVALKAWASLRLTIGRFLGSIRAIGDDLCMDPVVHWCVKQGQRVPMSMGSPSLLLEKWS